MQWIKRGAPAIKLNQWELDELRKTPAHLRDLRERNMLEIIRGKQNGAYERKRVQKYGLWDDEAASKGKLVITRIIHT